MNQLARIGCVGGSGGPAHADEVLLMVLRSSGCIFAILQPPRLYKVVDTGGALRNQSVRLATPSNLEPDTATLLKRRDGVCDFLLQVGVHSYDPYLKTWSRGHSNPKALQGVVTRDRKRATAKLPEGNVNTGPLPEAGGNEVHLVSFDVPRQCPLPLNRI